MRACTSATRLTRWRRPFSNRRGGRGHPRHAAARRRCGRRTAWRSCPNGGHRRHPASPRRFGALHAACPRWPPIDGTDRGYRGRRSRRHGRCCCTRYAEASSVVLARRGCERRRVAGCLTAAAAATRGSSKDGSRIGGGGNRGRPRVPAAEWVAAGRTRCARGGRRYSLSAGAWVAPALRRRPLHLLRSSCGRAGWRSAPPAPTDRRWTLPAPRPARLPAAAAAAAAVTRWQRRSRCRRHRGLALSSAAASPRALR